MPKRVRTGLTRTDILDRYVQRFKQQLRKIHPYLSRKRSVTSIDEFDDSAEELISQVFGAASDEAEAYFYAKNGESALLPEEAQENGTHDVERASVHQRRQVLESCLSDLELRRRVQAARHVSIADGKHCRYEILRQSNFFEIRRRCVVNACPCAWHSYRD